MTGVDELREMRVVSAAPEVLRVSVVGGRTQLDVALPADVAVAAFLPELARLIRSRDDERDSDVADRDERRTFWVLSRDNGAGAIALEADRTLRDAGVHNGELLRLSAQRALSPPTLYDDVVDAAARLNRAAYAAWNATSARVMAFAGLWLCAAVWIYFLLAEELSPHRGVIVAGAALTTIVLVGGAAVVNRVIGRADIAAATGPPVVAVGAALGWVATAGYGAYGVSAACAVLLVLTVLCYRVIGTGHWAYFAAGVVFVFGALALLSRALGVRVDVSATVTAAVAVFGCLAVPMLTARLGRFPMPTTVSSAEARKNDPFVTTVMEGRPATPMPSAEEVWARVRSAGLTRSGLLTGLAAVVVVGAVVLLRAEPGWAAFVFALDCAAVLALRSRRVSAWPERAALAVPAVALVLLTCVQAQSGETPLQLGGVAVLVVLAVGAVLVGSTRTDLRQMRSVAAYSEYAAVAALIPLALWPLGIYDRLGLW